MNRISKIEIFKNFLEKERPLNKGVLTKLESNLKTNFIYNSNAIEGSTLTLKETDIILQYGVTVKGKSLKEHEEVKGQEYALNFLKEVIKTNETLVFKINADFPGGGIKKGLKQLCPNKTDEEAQKLGFKDFVTIEKLKI